MNIYESLRKAEDSARELESSLYNLCSATPYYFYRKMQFVNAAIDRLVAFEVQSDNRLYDAWVSWVNKK